MVEIKEFDSKFLSVFPQVSFDTLVYSPFPRLRFDMGGEYEGLERVDRVMLRNKEILSFVFTEKDEIWIRITLWKKHEQEKINEKEVLRNVGLDLDSFNNFLCNEGKLGTTCLLYLSKFNYNLIAPILRGICHSELGIEPSLEATSYFVRFNSTPTIINLYDDRGMDMIMKDKLKLREIYEQFNNWILDYDRERIEKILS